MQTIDTYIVEKLNLNKQFPEILFQMFKSTKLSRDNIRILLNNLDMSIIKRFEKYIKEIDAENAFPYLVQDDMFLKEENKNKIIDMLSDYVFKFVASI